MIQPLHTTQDGMQTDNRIDSLQATILKACSDNLQKMFFILSALFFKVRQGGLAEMAPLVIERSDRLEAFKSTDSARSRIEVAW